MLTRDRYICALDIGTAKVCAVVADVSEEVFIGFTSSPARGVSQAAAVDTSELTDVIGEVVTKLEEKTGLRIKDVYTNISGSHIESRTAKGKVIVHEEGGGITADDINKAVNFAKDLGLPLERRIIHAIIQNYTVDGQGGIANPINLYGRELEVNLYLITGSTRILEKLTKSINCAGLSIKEFLLSAIASACGVLTEEEKKQGVLLVDIGAGVMDVSIFKEGAVKFARVIPLENLELSKAIVSVKEALANSGYLTGNFFSGAVITGGYTSFGGLSDSIEKILGVSTRIGLPHSQYLNTIPELQSPAYATIVGLIQYGYERERSKNRLSAAWSGLNKVVSWAKKTLSTYF